LAALLNDDGDALAYWVSKHSHNRIGLTALAQQLIENGKLTESKRPLQTLLTLYPGDTSPDNAHRLLASVHKTLRETAAERKLLERYSRLDADCLDVYLRSIELEEAAGNWSLVLKQTRRALAVDPLVPDIHRARALSAENMKKSNEAIAAYRVLLSLEPQDLALVHYRLASLLHQKRDPAAKRHVLAALEEAPRYRAAHRLLLRLVRSKHAILLKGTRNGSRKPIIAKRPSSEKRSR
jgi:tetratricopeptide (TPR) repeat protein